MHVQQDWAAVYPKKVDGSDNERTMLDLGGYMGKDRDDRNLTVMEKILYKSHYPHYQLALKTLQQEAVENYEEKYWPLVNPHILPLIANATIFDPDHELDPMAGDTVITPAVFKFQAGVKAIEIRTELTELTVGLRFDAVKHYNDGLEKFSEDFFSRDLKEEADFSTYDKILAGAGEKSGTVEEAPHRDYGDL